MKKKFNQSSTIERVSLDALDMLENFNEKNLERLKKLIHNYPTLIHYKISKSSAYSYALPIKQQSTLLGYTMLEANYSTPSSFPLIFSLIQYLVEQGANINIRYKEIIEIKDKKSRTKESSFLFLGKENKELYLFLLKHHAQLLDYEYEGLKDLNQLANKQSTHDFLNAYEPIREKMLLEKIMNTNNPTIKSRIKL